MPHNMTVLSVRLLARQQLHGKVRFCDSFIIIPNAIRVCKSHCSIIVCGQSTLIVFGLWSCGSASSQTINTCMLSFRYTDIPPMLSTVYTTDMLKTQKGLSMRI